MTYADRPRHAASLPRASAWRRLLAFAVDYLAIAVWLALLAAAGFAARRAGLFAGEFPQGVLSRLGLHVLFFALLTLPILLYFALFEASRWQATPGKRVLRVRVVSAADFGRLPIGRSLIRSAVKFLPWEIGHLGVWHVPGQPFVDEPGLLSLACWTAAMLLSLFWVASLFVGGGRSPYDAAAGARVVHAG